MNTKKVTIGLLLPSSTILPMSKDFEKGFKQGMNELIRDEEWEIELVNEFIAEGSKEKAEAAINKLTGFCSADIITGILSNRAATVLAEKMGKSKTSFLINNIGEHLPDPALLGTSIYLNSTHLWQQIWSLGYWGVNRFGPKGMFVGGVYDSGYSFTAMLQLGMNAANPDAVMPFAVAPVHKIGELADVASVFTYIEQFNPDFVFAAFCGEEASIFLKEYRDRGYAEKIPLLGTPFLLQPFESNGATVEIYTPVSSNEEITAPLNGLGELADNPFPHLGYEAGLLVKAALQKGGVKDLAKNLSEVEVTSERGLLHINAAEPGKSTQVYLVKNTTNGAEVTKELLQPLETVMHTDQRIVNVINEPSSGWYNPYPGV